MPATFYCIANNMIVMCDEDFTVQPDSWKLATVETTAPRESHARCEAMLHRANTQPGLLEALEDVVSALSNSKVDGVFAFYHAHGQTYDGPRADMDAARAAIAAAKGE